MTKTSPQPLPRTHFEQIPVKVVKKIANAEGRKTRTADPDNLIVEPTSEKIEPYSGQIPMFLRATSPWPAERWRCGRDA